jgi:hypothetical protein
MAKLSVSFQGVFGLTPNNPVFDRSSGYYESQNPKWVDFLFPNLLLSYPASWLNPADVSTIAPPHFPLLILPSSNYDSDKSTLKPDASFMPDGVASQVFFLTDKYFQLQGATDVAIDAKIQVAEGKDLPSGSDLGSLWWIPRTEALSPVPSHARVDKALNYDLWSKNSPPKFPERIVSYLRVTQGRLKVADYFKDKNENIVKVPFRLGRAPAKSDSSWNRAVGNSISWEIEVNNAYFDLMHYTENRSEPFSIFLKPDANNQIAARILNVEPETAFCGKPSFLQNASQSPDADFEILYSLADELYPIGPVPDMRDGSINRLDKPCSPVLFQGFSRE